VKDTIEDQRKCKEYKTFSGNIIIGLLSSHNVLPLKVLFIYLLLKRFQRRRHAFHLTKRIELQSCAIFTCNNNNWNLQLSRFIFSFVRVKM
jgi:hypothetical protein